MVNKYLNSNAMSNKYEKPIAPFKIPGPIAQNCDTENQTCYAANDYFIIRQNVILKKKSWLFF